MDNVTKGSIKNAIDYMTDQQLARWENDLVKSSHALSEKEEEATWEIVDMIREEQGRRKHDREDVPVDWDEQDRRAYEEEKLDNLRREQ